jgi:hypothetical protein
MFSKGTPAPAVCQGFVGRRAARRGGGPPPPRCGRRDRPRDLPGRASAAVARGHRRRPARDPAPGPAGDVAGAAVRAASRNGSVPATSWPTGATARRRAIRPAGSPLRSRRSARPSPEEGRAGRGEAPALRLPAGSAAAGLPAIRMHPADARPGPLAGAGSGSPAPPSGMRACCPAAKRRRVSIACSAASSRGGTGPAPKRRPRRRARRPPCHPPGQPGPARQTM